MPPAKMPLKDAPNGDLSPFQLKVLLGWLQSKVVSPGFHHGAQRQRPSRFPESPGHRIRSRYCHQQGLTSSPVLIHQKSAWDAGEFIGKALGSTQVESAGRGW